MKGSLSHWRGECEEAYSSLSRRLRTMLVRYKHARAAGQQPAWMMSVHAELERIGGERKVSLVKKRRAQHNEHEVVRHVGPVEAPARAETSPQPPPKNNYDVQFRGHGVSSIHQRPCDGVRRRCRA